MRAEAAAAQVCQTALNQAIQLRFCLFYKALIQTISADQMHPFPRLPVVDSKLVLFKGLVQKKGDRGEIFIPGCNTVYTDHETALTHIIELVFQQGTTESGYLGP